ncbi:TatD DNase family protein [Rhodoligotrophos appendicifer]|uniref:TatD family hydrolase n=1 Tax=Rhodoligotrophos appendicifer TaxID=987056 RepID=UPI0011847CB8|nr:TatD family hydrolase [Rhodoligotrophos appendicifer]
MTSPLSGVVDSHCHLDFADFDDRDAVIERARAAGVKLMVTISTRVRQFDKIRALIETYEDVFATIGTHPHNAGEEMDVTAAELIEIARDPKVVGIGEAGLDYHYDLAPREAQMAGFRTHIAAARETGLPLVIHSREAEDDTAVVLEEEMGKGAFTPLLHCFSSDMRLARRGLKIGAYISFSGIMTFKTAQALRDVAAEVPLERLLVETDAPYLAPVPKRGKRNEPAYVVHTLKALAEVKGLDAQEMANITTDNFHRLFTKVPRL